MRKAININNYFNPRQNDIKIKPFELEFNRKKDRNINDSQQYKQEHPVAPLNHTKTQEFTPLRKKMTADSDYEQKRNDISTERQREISPNRTNRKQNINSTYRPYYEQSSSPMKSKSSYLKSGRQLSYELETNINKLKDIKVFLQNEISSLQNLLDDTSRNIQRIDKQFFVIKQKILSYTARSLDTAFKNYKKKMTRWTKYQDIQKKSIDVLKELKQYIADGENKLKNQDQRSEITEKTVKEITDRVQHYKLTSNQIKKVREECYSKHPIIQQDKIIEFQKAVQEICCF